MADSSIAKRELHRMFDSLSPSMHGLIEQTVDLTAPSMEVVVPAPGESAVVTLHVPKTAALLYDRVWSPLTPPTPESVRLCGGTTVELFFQIVTFLAEIVARELPAEPDVAWWTFEGRFTVSRVVVEALAKVGVVAVPMYDTARDCSREYRSGSYEVVLGALQNIPVPVESALSWEQILEIRQDRASRLKLRRFKHWLDAEMVGRSQMYIADEIAIRLADYEAALKKHGVATALGCLQTALDSKVLTGGAAAIASLSFASSPSAALLAGGAVVVGSVAVHLARTLLDIESVREAAQPEVAFVAEIARRGEE